MNDHATYAKMIADFARSLQVRPDRARCCSVLAGAFIEHRDELWPEGGPEARPEWITDHVPGILAQVASMFSIAAITDDEDTADEFLLRMAWVPTLIQDLDARHGRLDA